MLHNQLTKLAMACVLGIIWLQIGFYSLLLGRKKYYITKRHCITSVLLYCFKNRNNSVTMDIILLSKLSERKIFFSSYIFWYKTKKNRAKKFCIIKFFLFFFYILCCLRQSIHAEEENISEHSVLSWLPRKQKESFLFRLIFFSFPFWN